MAESSMQRWERAKETEAHIAALQVKLDCAVEALEWYGDDRNYDTDENGNSTCAGCTRIDNDDGERARACLEKIRNEKGE